MMKYLHTPSRHSQRAFSLTEIMVGMAIGMLGVIVIMQMTSLFESRKRTTASGDDAQNGGAIALYSIQNQITQAGFGISSPYLIGKSLTTPNITLNPLEPVTINPAQLAAIQTANTDSFIVIYGNGNTPSEGSLIQNATFSLPYMVTGGTGNAGVGDGGTSFTVGDWVIPSQSGVTACSAGTCASASHALYQVIGPAAPTSVSVNGAPPPLAYVATNNNPPLLFNLGATPALLAYAIINGALNVCDYLANNCAASALTVEKGGPWTKLADGIINMRLTCEASSGLRIVLVSRSVQIEPNANVVTTTTPIWNPNGVSAPVVASPTATWGANWNQYRYKTFETILPIRNAIWAGVSGC